TIISNYRQTAGLPDRPQTTLPLHGTDAPPPPALRPDGSLVGGPQAIPSAISWLQYQYNYYKQLEREARIEPQTLREIRSIMNTALLIQSQIPTLISQNPSLAPSLSEQEENLESIIRNFGRLIPAARRKILYP
ncbi:MAG: hypothetical protein NZL93_06445, partial [Chthoniobacterales bacterium]|nr:hypothetical protein [Chthoniobacterales bacterium]